MKLSHLSRLPRRWQARALRTGFNLHPAFRSTGGRVEYVAPSLLHIRIRLSLTRRTRNVVGSLFGGSLFSVTDGVHAAMLMARLGPDAIVWDKSASIRYRKPAFHTLYADFVLSETELQGIRDELAARHEAERCYEVELKDAAGRVHTVVQRMIYIADKSFYKQKLLTEAVGDTE